MMEDNRNIALGTMYSENINIGVNNPYLPIFNEFKHCPISNYLSKEDLYMLYKLSNDPKYNTGNIRLKLKAYDYILNNKGFIRSYSGTNRVIYTIKNDNTFILKIALDSVGIEANKGELQNQNFLKPYVPKIFDMSQCGTVLMMERVEPIMNRDNFSKHASDIYDIIIYLIGHGFVLEDIGTEFFMNWGIRKKFGPVLLDFPYLYRSNSNRRRCVRNNENSKTSCFGKIDYDDGYNYLECKKCGKRYAAKDIGSQIDYFKRRGKIIMKNNAFVFNLTIDGKKYEKVISTSSNSNNISIKKKKQPQNQFNNKKKEVRNEKNTEDRNQRVISIDSQVLNILKKVNEEYNVTSTDINTDLSEYVAKYMEDNYNKYIEVHVIAEPSCYLKDMKKEELSEYNANISNEFRLPNGKSIYYDFDSSLINVYISKAHPIVDKEKLLSTIEEAIRSYYESLDVKEYRKYIDDKNKEEDKNTEKIVDNIIDTIFKVSDNTNDKVIQPDDKNNDVSIQRQNAIATPIKNDNSQTVNIVAKKADKEF